MVKYWLGCGMALMTWAAVTPALATINPEAFTDPGYVAGNALSAFFWDDGTPDTSGVLDIEDVGGIHQRVVKLTANGPDPGPVFPGVNGQAGATVGGGWGGPGRVGGVPGPLWFRVDVEKGSGDGLTSLTDNIWSLSFIRPNGATIFTLDSGLTQFRLRSSQNSYASSNFNLHDGWNQLIVLNDNSANPNTKVYQDGVEVLTFHAGTGPLTSNTTNTGAVSLNRQSRGGDGDHFVGSMRFDNFFTANESLFAMPDVNMDGFVDIFDVNEVSANWATIGAPYSVAGDANKDGTVDIFDINMISANWSPAPSGSAAVPEPTSVVLFCLGLAGLLAVGRKRIGR